MISFISSFEVTHLQSDNCIPASPADAGVFNPNGIETLLVNGSSTFFIKVKPAFSDGPRNPRNPPDCFILESLAFGSFVQADEYSAKALQSLKTCASVNNNFFGKLISSFESLIIFDESFKNSLVLFFISDFNLYFYLALDFL